MQLDIFLKKLSQNPDHISFADTMAVIEENYQFTPTAFRNGMFQNEAGQNSGSCKLFSFARLNALSKDETLHCFGDYYRIDVLQHPQGTDHQNIRHFIEGGWEGIIFSGKALVRR